MATGDEILDRALALVEAEGAEALTMRRLAGELGVATTTIYWHVGNRDDLETFAMSYLFFAGIFEGCWFYNGFNPIFALQRRGLMKGTGEQLQYILRDEAMHCAFGLRVVNQLLEEENLKLDPTQLQVMWEEAEAVEASVEEVTAEDAPAEESVGEDAPVEEESPPDEK